MNEWMNECVTEQQILMLLNDLLIVLYHVAQNALLCTS